MASTVERNDLWERFGAIAQRIEEIRCARDAAADDEMSAEIRLLVGRNNFGRGRVVPITDEHAVRAVRVILADERTSHQRILDQVAPLLREIDEALSSAEAILGIETAPRKASHGS